MKNKEEHYLNVTLKNEQNEKEEIVVTLSGIFKMLKKYFLIWLITAVIIFVFVFAGVAISANTGKKKPLTALVSFTYSGIEQGLDPAGRKFDVNSIKKPVVIEKALTGMGRSVEEVESVRRGMKINGIIPPDAIDKITVYKSVYESAQSSALAAAQSMLDVKVYPTQYQVFFDYSDTNYNKSQAAEVLNAVLESYDNYFFDTYGYNEALGSAVTAVDYKSYDYAEAIDVFNTTLTTLRNYVNTLSSSDKTRFRSAQTGYTFADLSAAIKTIQEMDLDVISSYVTVNNVTKDKEALITYYEYRIDSLKRSKIIAEENLASVTESIDGYVKDDIIIFGNGTDNTNTKYTQASEQYDKLIEQKNTVQSELSTVTQQIQYYNQRKAALNGRPAGTEEKIARVENDLDKLSEKIAVLIDNVNKTADEYYEDVSFADAYNILVPASGSVKASVMNAVHDSIFPGIISEALLFVVYIIVAFVMAIVSENKKKGTAIAEAAAESSEEEKKID